MSSISSSGPAPGKSKALPLGAFEPTNALPYMKMGCPQDPQGLLNQMQKTFNSADCYMPPRSDKQAARDSSS